MKACSISTERLQRWFDGEVTRRDEVTVHVEQCEHCTAQVASWRHAGEQLAQIVDDGVGEVEPLLALRSIRERIADAEARSPSVWLRNWWQDAWAAKRRAMAGVAIAVAAGIVTAPAFVYWLGNAELQQGGPAIASVVVESLEFDGDSRAVVYRPGSGQTTIIWVEAEDSYGATEN